ncbi:protein kinase domain-containing protein [Actinophytocola xanthii]|uniref:non-specific serine/threonine protein kinase n=1 Tax=Actinophytocola xanthii TaxID=1912961 RepID=A0A1Q8CRX1_9PSEU|nr:protein kinase [Actinophytocola xanthii]OLF17074.1 hypothetical protein BU204_13350 [Actinophytocola xanthii]
MGPLLGERYQVVHPVWRDRLGETHVARDERTGCPVAVRLLRGALATRAVAARLHEERARLVAVRDPHLAAVLDLVEEGAVLAVVSEVVEGQTLRGRLRAGALSAAEIAGVGAGVAAGLAALHEVGLAHGHVDAGTVVLTPTGEVRLTDVGPAHLVTAAPGGREALRAGPAPAPELAAGAVPGPAVDLYALGGLLADLTAGRWPSPVQRLARRLRSRDPHARPTAAEVRTRLSRPENPDDEPTTRPSRRGLARAR